MITLKDIETILIDCLKALMPVESIFVTDDIPEGMITEERIVIHVKRTSVATYFNKNFVEVNWCVPDIEGRPDSKRLGEVERELATLSSAGEYDGTGYNYSIDSTEIIKSELGCHYLNVRLLFEILNVN